MTENAESVNVNAFLDYLNEHEPDTAANYVSEAHPQVNDDLSDGPLTATIDGWWYVTQIEGAIRAAVAELIEEHDALKKTKEALAEMNAGDDW